MCERERERESVRERVCERERERESEREIEEASRFLFRYERGGPRNKLALVQNQKTRWPDGCRLRPI